MKTRREKFLALYKDGHTLLEIGRLEGITRERVRQILSTDPYYFKLRGERLAAHGAQKKKCLLCRKTFYGLKRRKFCSQKCYGAGRRTETDLRKAKPRKCSRCKQVKKPEEFYPRYGRKAESVYCRKCHMEIGRLWKQRNPERWRKINKKATENYWRRKFGLPELPKKTNGK